VFQSLQAAGFLLAESEASTACDFLLNWFFSGVDGG